MTRTKRKVRRKSRPNAQRTLAPAWLALGGVAAVALGFALGLVLRQHLGLGRTVEPTAAPPRAEAEANPATARRIQASADDDPAWGPEDAPVVIIEFSDYQCPYCRRFWSSTYQRLREVYGDKVRFVYRDFPLAQIHPDALGAAIAANCAGEQGQYWAFHDRLFEQASGLGLDAYLAYAKALGLDLDAFRACLDDPQQRAEVLADQADGARLGVSGTPTFFINGIPLVGAQPFEAFQQIIEQELNGSP